MVDLLPITPSARGTLHTPHWPAPKTTATATATATRLLIFRQDGRRTGRGRAVAKQRRAGGGAAN